MKKYTVTITATGTIGNLDECLADAIEQFKNEASLKTQKGVIQNSCVKLAFKEKQTQPA